MKGKRIEEDQIIRTLLEAENCLAVAVWMPNPLLYRQTGIEGYSGNASVNKTQES